MTASTSSQNVLAAIADDMRAVDQLIRHRLASEVVLINQISEYIINSGGKRLRPALLLLVANALGVTSPARFELAAVIEFIHTSTLLHDDVVDESDLRRGKQTANALFGNAASVLVGDFLYSRSFEMMVSVDNMRVMQILARATNVIAEGEVLQLAKTRDLTASAADYDEVIGAKTATLFEAATEVGAMAGGADAAGREALRLYGRELGFAFQLVDDVLDYRGEAGTLGKNTGDDLREGKMTLPIILALVDSTPAERSLIEKALGDAEVADETVARVVAILEKYDTLNRTVEKAHAHARAAREALRVLPASEMRTLLGDVAELSVARAV